MSRTMTPNQELLTDYLIQKGATLLDRLIIIAELWDEDATIEMLKYIQKTREQSPAKLYETALKISKKYRPEENLPD